MPKFGCRCGHSIPLHAMPCEHEALLTWDHDREAHGTATVERWRELLRLRTSEERDAWARRFYGSRFHVADALDEPGVLGVESLDLSIVLQDIEDRSDTFSRAVVRCPECSRLYVERSHRSNEYDCYAPEHSAPATSDEPWFAGPGNSMD